MYSFQTKIFKKNKVFIFLMVFSLFSLLQLFLHSHVIHTWYRAKFSSTWIFYDQCRPLNPKNSEDWDSIMNSYPISCKYQTKKDQPLCPKGLHNPYSCSKLSLSGKNLSESLNKVFEFKSLFDNSAWEYLKLSPGKQFKKCAFVGSSGILDNRGWGKEIDLADAIFRANIVSIPLGKEKDVGQRTDFFYLSLATYNNASHFNLIQQNIPKGSKIFFEVRSSKEKEKEIYFRESLHDWLEFFPFFISHREKFKGILDKIYASIASSSGGRTILFFSKYCQEIHLYGFFTNCIEAPLKFNYHFYSYEGSAKEYLYRASAEWLPFCLTLLEKCSNEHSRIYFHL
jgi:hypothetical protein